MDRADTRVRVATVEPRATREIVDIAESKARQVIADNPDTQAIVGIADSRVTLESGVQGILERLGTAAIQGILEMLANPDILENLDTLDRAGIAVNLVTAVSERQDTQGRPGIQELDRAGTQGALGIVDKVDIPG